MVIQKMSNKKGFTLIELLVVVAIIAILAAIAIPQYAKYKKNAAEASAEAAITTGITQLQAEYTDSGTDSLIIGVGNDNVTLKTNDGSDVYYDAVQDGNDKCTNAIHKADNDTIEHVCISGIEITCDLIQSGGDVKSYKVDCNAE